MNQIFDLLKDKLGLQPEDVEILVPSVGGATNKSTVFTHKGGKYFLRLGTPQSGPLRINRYSEYEALSAMSGTIGQILYFNPQSGDMVMDFIEGTVIGAEDLFKREWINKVADLFKELHSKRINHEFDPFADIESRFDYCRTHDIQLPEKLDSVLDMSYAIQERLWTTRKNFYGLCHNDPFAGNFIYGNDGKLKLIDYEFAGNGDIFFDMACLAWGYTPELRKYLLERCLGQCTSELYSRLRDSVFVVALWNASWAAVKSETQTQQSGFDYKAGLLGVVNSLVGWDAATF